jgi:pSer/pThr/pTyr-binding forkhead associated (FHA) protein
MSDSRFNSIHLGELPRRQDYRRARAAVFDARGMITLAAEQVQGMVLEADAWQSLLPDQLDALVLGTKYILIDQQSASTYPLKIGPNTIGRCPNNDVVFPDPGISRRHCVILLHARGRRELHDTASLNGTHVNAQRVRQPVLLASGDRIRLAKRQLFFVSVQEYLADPDMEQSAKTRLE